jgi:hypothetical protein
VVLAREHQDPAPGAADLDDLVLGPEVLAVAALAGEFLDHSRLATAPTKSSYLVPPDQHKYGNLSKSSGSYSIFARGHYSGFGNLVTRHAQRGLRTPLVF